MGAVGLRGADLAAAWAAARRIGEFSYSTLGAETGLSIKRATALVKAWLEEGSVELLGKRDGAHLLFRVVTTSEAPPRAGTPQGNMWFAMRKFGAGFSPTDIAAHATTDTVSVSIGEAGTYCQMLVRAGYLRVARKAIPGRREAIYRLIRDTGPIPPRERRVRAVWDQNLCQFTHLPEGL